MSVSAIIIDDEKNNIENLSILLGDMFPELSLVGSALDATKAEFLILQENPDIVFLDIQMPGKNGFDLLNSLTVHDFQLIFVTAFDQFGIQAIRFSAIDYLLKPVHPPELKRAVQRAMIRSQERKQNRQLENLLNVLQNQQYKETHRIALSTSTEIRFVGVSEIVRCESSNNYTTFYLAHGEVILTSKPIFEFEEMMKGYGFIRCHQTHIVNKRFIKSLIKSDGGYLLLENGFRAPISRLKRNQVKKDLESF